MAVFRATDKDVDMLARLMRAKPRLKENMKCSWLALYALWRALRLSGLRHYVQQMGFQNPGSFANNQPLFLSAC